MNGPQFLVDTDGTRTAVLLDLETYEKLLEAWEDREDIRDGTAALAAIAAGEEEVISFAEVMAELDAQSSVS
jgi:hypothetical protein